LNQKRKNFFDTGPNDPENSDSMTEVVPQRAVAPDTFLINSVVGESADTGISCCQFIMQFPEDGSRWTLRFDQSAQHLPRFGIIIRNGRGAYG